MRHLVTLPEQTARTLADYLLTLKIRTQLMPEEGGTGVWVCDEDQVSRARQELVEFERNPADARYRAAGAVADSLRRQESHLEQSYRRRQERFRRKMHSLAPGHGPVTIGLLVISIGVTVATNFGNSESPFALSIWFNIFKIFSGEVWRLVTPIFLHLSVLHLVFNMMMLVSFGGAVEARRGSLRMILLVLVLAIGSNLVQYYLGHPVLVNGQMLVLVRLPWFGGMSGVLYGLFGYLWMKSRFEPQLGLFMPRETAIIMIVWFFLCLFGAIGPVANGAHAGGLVLGMLIGYAPSFWRWLRGGGSVDV
jgi:GlpG protein